MIRVTPDSESRAHFKLNLKKKIAREFPVRPLVCMLAVPASPRLTVVTVTTAAALSLTSYSSLCHESTSLAVLQSRKARDSDEHPSLSPIGMYAWGVTVRHGPGRPVLAPPTSRAESPRKAAVAACHSSYACSRPCNHVWKPDPCDNFCRFVISMG